MTSDNTDQENWSIDRRTALKTVGVAGVGMYGFSGAAKAKGGGGPPGQSCDCDDSEGDFIAKYEFQCTEQECAEYDDENEECLEYECVEWGFVLEEGMDVVDITVIEVKDDDDSEPITVEFEADGYVVQSVCAFGGNDTNTTEDEDGITEFESDLENPGGQQAAISNITFCGVEEEEPTLPECPLYGTSRSDPTAVFSIRYDPDTDEIVEVEVGDIPDESGNSNYPNGLAFDPDNEVWYFAEEGGILKTMNEDGALGIEVYGDITGGADIAGAAFWNDEDEYLYIPNGTNKLMAADISSGDAETREVAELDWSNIGLGDLAIDRDTGVLYVSTTNSNIGPNFFSVDLNDTDEQELIVQAPADSTEFATGKQIAFAEGTLWAHEAGGGGWWTVDVDDGSLSDLVDTTREYTDLAQCGFFELDE